jgi:hypothetical protein
MNKKVLGLAYLQIVERETEGVLHCMLGEDLGRVFALELE